MTDHTRQPATCRVCGRDGVHEFYRVREMMFGTGDAFDYFQCTFCQCLQIGSVPADISRYYPAEYYSYTPKYRPFQKYRIDRLMRRLRDRYTVFDRSLIGSFISRFTPNKKLSALSRIGLTPDSRILDVGCGDGWRLYALREIGFRNLLGIDPYLQQDIAYQNGVKVLKRSIREMSGEWDVVMYHHSFEHVPEPLQELRAVARLLVPGGCCLIRIPTVSSFAWETYREHWVQLDAPRHYYLHSLKSMELLAGSTGFMIKDVVFDSTKDQFQGSELYRKGIPLISGSGVFSDAQQKAWKQEARKLNRDKRGDQAAFYLIRKADAEEL